MADVTLAAFLSEAARTPFVLGRFDCLIWLGDWVRSQTGRDPIARWRGRYSTPLGYHRILRKAGGAVNLVAAEAEAAGLRLTGAPGVGAIGVVQAITLEGAHEVGAIRTALGWASLSPHGLLVGQTQALAAWEI